MQHHQNGGMMPPLHNLPPQSLTPQPQPTSMQMMDNGGSWMDDSAKYMKVEPNSPPEKRARLDDWRAQTIN